MRIVPDTWIDVNELVGLGDDQAIRGLGHTTHQMQTAPEGSIFVWCSSHLHYPRQLARHLGRTDLTIKPDRWFEDGMYRFTCRSPIVIDHAYARH